MPTNPSSDADTPQQSTRLGGDGYSYPIAFIEMSRGRDKPDTVGGMLVTDNTGVPIEFIITTAVRPTEAQKVLYGDRLRSFVTLDLCAKELLSSIKTPPKVAFVRDAELLDAWKHVKYPVLQLVPVESLGQTSARPTVIAPRDHPEFAEAIDLASLHMDMLEVFNRIEKCRQLLAKEKKEYQV